MKTNNPEDNQWESWARNEIKNELPNVFVIDAEDEIIAMCRTLLSQQAEKQRKEWGESLLEIEKRLKDLTNNNET